ncbi:hypothetical protein GE061_005773 [Apolygus lucorum]|uniref:Uncharacterized protein n=1 Tax=Apolygus lucorum TaxID=248454 RepID=A0A8S9X173_APOLU|nr:hypothetical protein GE061_005773 [Apolygus lucorum]
MARAAIFVICFISIVFPSVFAGVLQRNIGPPVTKEDAIAKAKMGADLGFNLISTSINMYSASVQYDSSLNAATKQCIVNNLGPVKEAVKVQVQAYLDAVVQRLSATPDAEVRTAFVQIVKELFKDSGTVANIKDNLETELTDVRETCEEQNDNSA